MASGIRLTTEDFIAMARDVHGDRYDYSKVEYVNSKTKVCIICPIHGEFWQIPSSVIARSYVKCMFSFVRKCLTVFQGNCTISHSHQQ